MKKLLFFASIVSGLFCLEASVEAQTQTSGGKILVAYFSLSGNTRTIAGYIHDTAGGDLFEIKTVTVYPGARNRNRTAEMTTRELETNARPVLSTQVNDMAQYDVIFLGYPIWWGTMPMALCTFLESYDFAGKTVTPFCTHDSSGLGRSVSDIQKLLPRSIIRDGLAVQSGRARRSQRDITAWLRKLGIIE